MRKILLTMIIAAGISTAALAQNGPFATATASASATIVAPIAITQVTDMNFGNIAVSAINAGTVVLPTVGARTATGGVTLPATNGNPTAASFTVTGASDYTYSISLPADGVTISDGTNSMTLTDFVSDPSGTGALTSGDETILVGATLNVGAAQPAGLYTNSTVVSVTVAYN